MYNTGPRPIVVQDLQLRFPDEPSSWFPQPWRTSRSELKPHADDGHKLPSAFAIRGLSAEQHFIEFGGPLPGITLKPQDYRVQIEGRLGHRPGWTPLLDFTLRASHILNPDDYLAYSNAPVEMSKEDKAKADEGFRKLAERLAEVTGKTPPPMPPAKRSRWKRLTRWQ